MTISDRIAEVRARIRASAEAAGRDPDSVRLVCVSKKQPSAAIAAAYDAGERDFGENYAQELAEKSLELTASRPDLRLHMIGHTQSNKAKLVAEHAFAIHSVDSVRLAHELDRRVGARERSPLRVLIEVNVAGEASKTGVAPNGLADIVAAARASKHLLLSGLMTMGPAGDASASLRTFRALSELREAHGGAHALPELSMGMSDDLHEAIAAGATIVRVGAAIFGRR